MSSKREREEAREVLVEFGACKCGKCCETTSELLGELGYRNVNQAREQLRDPE